MSSDRPVIVVKVGSSTLTDADGHIDLAYVDSLAAQLAEVREHGYDVVLVSSGAIAAGVDALGLGQRPTEMDTLQAAASVGQVAIIGKYADIMGRHGMNVGQVLLTRHDTAHRQQYLLACRTLETLIRMGVVPIVNENDTTAVEEIRFGDNDTLAALVGIMVNAELVVLLSDIEGVYDADPRDNEDAALVAHVAELDAAVVAAAGGPGTGLGSGGMATKIEAARVLMKAGIPMVVCDGRQEGCVLDAAEGRPVGTSFAAGADSVSGRKLWIAYGNHPSGTVVVDEGARAAVAERGKSLLPIGVVEVRGRFAEGDAVALAGPDGAVFARGLAGLSSEDLQRVAGLNTDAITVAEPRLAGREVVHRDHLVIL
jgi:glutamate 5-kinase